VAAACLSLVWAVSAAHGDQFSPVEDGMVLHNYDSGATSVIGVAGQWWPRVEWCDSPEWETQVVMEFDLSSVSGQTYTQSTFSFYMRNASGIDQAYVEVCGGDGNGGVDVGDWEAGTPRLTLLWGSPSPGVQEVGIDRRFDVDVTPLVNARQSDYLMCSIRFMGNKPDFNGSVFQTSTPFHFIEIAADENTGDGGVYRPHLELIPEPASLAVLGLGLPAIVRRRRR